jgi:hypothetical protein
MAYLRLGCHLRALERLSEPRSAFGEAVGQSRVDHALQRVPEAFLPIAVPQLIQKCVAELPCSLGLPVGLPLMHLVRYCAAPLALL